MERQRNGERRSAGLSAGPGGSSPQEGADRPPASEDAPETAADAPGEPAGPEPGSGPAEPERGAAPDVPAEVFAVRDRVTWRAVWRLTAFLILFVASIGFVAGGVIRGAGVGSITFMVIGVAGFLLFGAGLAVSLGGLVARRPVLELDASGVRRPAGWPLPRRAGRLLPWDEVAAITALRRGVPGTRRGEQDYVVFLPTPELAEMARTSDRPVLVALTMRDVPATAAAVPWCFAVGPGWDAALPGIVKEARRRRRVPVIDRRTR